MNRLLVILVLFVFAAVSDPSAADSPLEGLSGRSLADAVREMYAPSISDGKGWTPQAWMMPAEQVVTVFPIEWWRGDMPGDLYNLVGGPSDFTMRRYDYPPAPLETVEERGDGWEIGIWLGTNAWQPAADRRGDLARRVMYMALMYPRQLWGGRAVVVMDDGPWPLLNSAASRAYLEWHRADPADARELAEMAAVAAVQGNENPFVTLPSLAEYLWGDKAGTGYVPPEVERERTPLRGHYSRSRDAAVDLYSPHVPAGARWTLDGSSVAGTAVPMTQLATGTHELAFDAGTLKGKLTIIVEP